MKILEVYKDYYPRVGGLESHMRFLCEGLVKYCGCEVDMLAANIEPKLKIEEIGGVRVIRVPSYAYILSTPIAPGFIPWMYKLDYDIVHIHLENPPAVIAWLVSPRKGINVATYHIDIVRQKYTRYPYYPFLHAYLRKCDKIVAYTPNLIETSPILKRYKNNCVVIPHGLRRENFIPTPERIAKAEEIKRKYHRPIILFVGRLVYYKGVDILVEAMKDLQAQLILIGDGPHRKVVEEAVKRCGNSDRVEILGNLPNAEVAPYYYACEILALPSINRTESYGQTQIEAMACGKPVIATRVNTGVEWVNQHGKTGLLVQPGNPAELRNAILELLEHPDKARELGANGKARVDGVLNDEIMSRSHFELFTRLLNEKNSRG